ncbi:MAG: transporter substrate-binding domain-containing protein [Erysipelotrichaceae bacterium]
MKRLITLTTIALLLTGCTSASDADATNTFTVGMECNYAPFNWTTVEEGESTVAITSVDYCDGYDVVIAQQIADELGMELVIKKISWDGLEPAVNSGEIDAIIAGMTATEEREENVDFTSPYYESEMVMIVRADGSYVDATSIQDFAGATVLGQLNTLYDDVIDQINDVIHATPLDTYPRMVLSLQENDVDGLVAELPVAIGVVAANPDLAIVQFSEGSGFDADTTVSIAVSEGNSELRDAIQSVLDGIDADTRNDLMTQAVDRQPATE